MGLIRLLIYIFLLYFIYTFVKKMISGTKEKEYLGREEKKLHKGEDLVEDPLCHTYIPESLAYPVIIDGRKLYFCSKKCADQYQSRYK